MRVPKGDPKRLFTYADYLTWPDDERWELFEGEAVAMTGPDADHQRISRRLCFLIEGFLQGKPCEMFDAPFDVLLPRSDEADEKVITVLQPDVMVVCDPDKVQRRGIRGGPDFVVEILSPSTASKDQVRKRRLYEAHGVKEYWVIDPIGRLVTVYRRSGLAGDGRFAGVEIEDAEGLQLEVTVLPGLTIDFARVLPPLPPKKVGESPASYRTRRSRSSQRPRKPRSAPTSTAAR